MQKERQIRNLQELKAKKQRRLQLMQMKSTKQGQIRAFNRQIFTAREEIEKEQRDLTIIEEDLRTLKYEINALQYESKKSNP